MAKQDVIRRKDLPMPSPLCMTLVSWLVMDRLDAPGWVWGAVGVFVGLIWIIWILAPLLENQREVTFK